MKIAVGADHGGFHLKEHIKQYLCSNGHYVMDKGALYYDRDDDYPDYAHAVASLVSIGDVERGILCCTRGFGMSMTANRYNGVRAAPCRTVEDVKKTREDNDTNVLALGGLYFSGDDAIPLVDTFLTVEAGGGRHARRAGKIDFQTDI